MSDLKTVEYDQHRNDLFAEIECKCPNERYKGSAVYELMKTKIKITGYADNHFFNVVNKEPRFLQCKCGRKYQYQWKPEGVEYKEVHQ
jgi:hypothetical protein